MHEHYHVRQGIYRILYVIKDDQLSARVVKVKETRGLSLKR
ncbi:hypothetical protein [Thioalkalivibrio sp.]